MTHFRPHTLFASALTFLLVLGHTSPTCAGPAPATRASFDIELGKDTLRVELVAAATLHVYLLDVGAAAPSSTTIDPARRAIATTDARISEDAGSLRLDAPRMHVVWDKAQQMLTVQDGARHPLLQQRNLTTLRDGRVELTHAAGQPLYGIGSYNATEDASAGLLRNGTLRAHAGEQGHAGAPFVWSTAGYGVLLDSDGASFTLQRSELTLTNAAKHPANYYIVLGTPAELFHALNRLSGASPLFPKWAMGFTNSQWGIDQKELLQIVDTYRAKHIPLDNITLDFDWKAWGEDNYGEFRWNPAKFPDGASGALKQQMDARGIHLTGIMKPRIHVDTVEGRYASAHDFWVPDEPVSDDYFSHKPVKNINFDLAAARQWFGALAIKYGYAHGIAGWWNDEADTVGSSTEFLNMQRALYDSQRAVTNQRAWSINRNFWLGAQRYAYGLWSGDINTGFASMAAQRVRMLSAINVGAMQWGMDGGGFRGDPPTPENYARWIQFGAFTPIFRVHGDFGQKRQPWRYGPIAERAATDAIRLRYALIPYIYSYTDRYRRTGVGLVRPLLFDWPHDPQLRNDVDAWLFGDWLLVAPVVEQGQTSKRIYLPAGRWTNWFSGRVYRGGQTISVATDSKTWRDIPLFVRDGAIIPTQPPMDFVGQHPLTQLDVEIFPGAQRSHFEYYDDDGTSYDYEHGRYYRQTLAVQRSGATMRFELGVAAGSFQPALRYYLLKIHGGEASDVDGITHAYASLDALQNSDGEGWASGHDRHGPVTWLRLAAARATTLTLTLKP